MAMWNVPRELETPPYRPDVHGAIYCRRCYQTIREDRKDEHEARNRKRHPASE